MEVSPLRALTLFTGYQSSHNISVEMEVSSLRALTHVLCHILMLDLFLAHLKTMRSCQKNMGLSYRCFELRRDTWNE